MKGEGNMSRFKLMLWNRCKLLLFLPFVMAVTSLFLVGINVTSARAADQPKNAHDMYKIRDPKVDPKMSPAARARVQKNNAIKKKQDARKFMQDVVEGKQPASSDKGGSAK
jgi:hypothetical protein